MDRQKIDQAFIGSCANGQLEDLEIAANILRGNTVATGVRLLVTPASQAVYREAMRLGYLQDIADAGAVITNSTCGACFGYHMGVVGPGEVCLTSSTRNFTGRMGSPDAADLHGLTGDRRRIGAHRLHHRREERDRMTLAITGKVWVFGDDLNTDAMYPAFAMKMDPPEAAKHVFYEVRPGWTDEVSPGDIVVAGKNFGLGSSRPVAALFTELGVAGLVAEEFNSLFFRNAVNAGLPAMTLPDATTMFSEGDTGTFDLGSGEWRNETTGASGSVPKLPDLILDIISSGGVLPRLAAQGYLPAELGDVLRIQHGGDPRRGQRRMIGKLLRNVRAGEHRSPFAGPDFAAPDDITVTSTAFGDGGAMPTASAGKGVGDNASPQLSWTGVPPQTRQLVLIIDDVDVPLPRPLLHTVAVIEPGCAERRHRSAAAGYRRNAFHPWRFGAPRICGPAPDSRPRAAPLPVPGVRA